MSNGEYGEWPLRLWIVEYVKSDRLLMFAASLVHKSTLGEGFEHKEIFHTMNR